MRESLKQTAAELQQLADDLARLLDGRDPLPPLLIARALVEVEDLRARLNSVVLSLQEAAAKGAPP
jgi:hypothetical protein